MILALNVCTAVVMVVAWVLLSGNDPYRAASIALMCASTFLFGLSAGRCLGRPR